MYHSFPQTMIANYFYYSGNIQYFTSFPHIFWTEPQQDTNLCQKDKIKTEKEGQTPCENIESHQTIEEKEQISQIYPSKKRNMDRRKKRQKEKQIESSKKNSQSNIVNHILCFLGKQNQSSQILTKIIQNNSHLSIFSSELKRCFYSALKLINLRRGRSYVNIKSLLNLFRPYDIIKQIPKIYEILPFGCKIEDLCYLFRVCIFYFLRTKSDLTILASRRMSYDGKKIHLKRLKNVIQKIIRKRKVEDNQWESE